MSKQYGCRLMVSDGLRFELHPGGLQWCPRHPSGEQHTGKTRIRADSPFVQAWRSKAAQGLQDQPFQPASLSEDHLPTSPGKFWGQGLSCGANPVDVEVLRQVQNRIKHDRNQMDVLMAIHGYGAEACELLKSLNLGADLSKELLRKLAS